MVAQNGHFAVAVVVELNFLVRAVLTHLLLFEFLLQSHTCIVSSKYFCRQVVHKVLQKLIKFGWIHAVKNVSLGFLGLRKGLKQLVHDWLNSNRVQIAHTVFAQKVKSNLVIHFKANVLTTEGATAHCVGLVLSLLVAHSKREFVYEVCAHSNLVVGHIVRLHFL